MNIAFDANIFFHESRLFLNLAISTLVLEIGATFSPALISSRVGTRLGKVALSGSTLANAVANLTCTSVITGVISASDTLSPQAFGRGNQREVGLLAMRAFFACMIVIVPVQLLVYSFGGMKFLFSWLGENETSSDLARQWYAIYLLGVPFYIIFAVIWRFLAAQEIMSPLTWTTILATFLFMPIILEYFLTTMGFIGSSWANVFYQVIQVIILFAFLVVAKPYYKQTWPGLSAWREALRWDPFWAFLRLGLGGVLSLSEWVYWESFSLIAGSLGVVPLNVHTIGASVIMVAFQIPFGIGAALIVRLGATLPNNVPRAKTLTIVCYLTTGILMGILCIIMYSVRHKIYAMFTSDDEIIEGCEEMWMFASLSFFFMSFFAVNVCVMNALGLQWTGGTMMAVFLCCFSSPAIYYTAITLGGGVTTIWKGFCITYAILDMMFFYYFATKDWYKISEEINKREMCENAIFDTANNSKTYGSIESASLL